MIKTLRMALKIDMTIAINSFIYSLSRISLFKNKIGDNIYSTKLKTVVRILGIILSLFRSILLKALYFIIIFYLAQVASANVKENFIHIYFVFTIIGLFINNKLLNTSTKKYYSLILFNMNAKDYAKYELFLILSTSFVFNFLALIIVGLILDIPLVISFSLLLFGVLARVIGEALNIFFYKKKGYLWTLNYPLFYTVLISLLLVSALPFINISFDENVVFITTFISFFLAGISYIYLMKVDDYKLIFKRLNTLKMVMNADQSKSYARENMVKIKDKDKDINNKKYIGKKGYDLFNTIFFERHKEILMRSSRNYAMVMILLFLIIILGVIFLDFPKNDIQSFLLNRLGLFVFIMYFINRGSVVTQAMFYNCDHAMLKYNFYRESDVIINLFKKRLATTIKVNLLPAVTMVLGIVLLLIVSGGTSFVNYVFISLFIILLSIFFSVHYLVIYYLLQPYNEKMEIKRFSYTFVCFITYVVAYSLSDVVMDSLLFSLFGLLFTVLYVLVGLFMVYKKAPKTFKLN